MMTFRCKIGTSDGRVVEKEFDAPNRQHLVAQLEEQGFHVFSVKRRMEIPFLSLSVGGQMSGRQFLTFNQELIVLLRSGLPILQILDTIIERYEAGGIRDVLREIREEIRGGGVLSEAFGRFPRHFPHLYVAALQAGERSGDLAITLGRYIAYQKRVETVKGKLRSAATYPILLCSAIVTVLLFLMLYVVPTFTQVYADAKVDLPWATKVLIAISSWAGKGAPLLFPSLIIAGLLLSWWVRGERGGRWFDRLKLHLPFFGRLVIDYALLGFCRTLGTTLSSGIPVVQALQMSRGTLNNRVLEERLSKAVLRVQEGTSVSAAFEETAFFPSLALRMIGVGESTGSLPEMLGDVADYYEAEVEKRLDRMTTLVEPLMMLVMGLVIGGIVVAMYIPIFQLAGTVR